MLAGHHCHILDRQLLLFPENLVRATFGRITVSQHHHGNLDFSGDIPRSWGGDIVPGFDPQFAGTVGLSSIQAAQGQPNRHGCFVELLFCSRPYLLSDCTVRVGPF